MTSSRLLGPRFRQATVHHWPSLCTIQTKTYTTSVVNQRVESGEYTDVTGLVNVPCRLLPLTEDERRDDRGFSGIESKFRRGVLKLNGDFISMIDTRRMHAVVDGVIWQIRGIENVSEKDSTRLKVEIING